MNMTQGKVLIVYREKLQLPKKLGCGGEVRRSEPQIISTINR